MLYQVEFYVAGFWCQWGSPKPLGWELRSRFYQLETYLAALDCSHCPVRALPVAETTYVAR